MLICNAEAAKLMALTLPSGWPTVGSSIGVPIDFGTSLD